MCIDFFSDMDVVVLFGCVVMIGFGVVENNVDICLGELVVVFGVGGVGLNIIQVVLLCLVYFIIVVDLYEGWLVFVRQVGVMYLINVSQVDVCMVLLDLMGKQGIDVFIDNIGQLFIIEMGYELIKVQGCVVLVGVLCVGCNISIYLLLLYFEKIISGLYGGEVVLYVDIFCYIRLFDVGFIQLKLFIIEYFKLDDINVVIQCMCSGVMLGCCLICMYD